MIDDDWDDSWDDDFSWDDDGPEQDPTPNDLEEWVSGFRWKTQDGQILRPEQMDTKHLFNCVRMIWNHTAPEELKLRPFKHWPGWEIVDPFHKQVAVTAFLRQLATRELTPRQRSDLEYMAQCCGRVCPDMTKLPPLHLH